MFKKLLNLLWSLRNQFFKYFIIGFSAVVADMATLILFKEVFGIVPVFAVVINQVILLVYIFLLNKYWTFRNKEISHKQIVRFLILTSFNYFFSVFTMYIFNHKINFDYRLVRILTIAIMTSWNFPLYKYWVYKEVEREK